mmetsp:Transcript_29891/g.48847  ORF Transcript_29891/g.48847 Transcript_29891/m.48847 type:complete len:84 (-) Transcript_29891:767-1018(-)
MWCARRQRLGTRWQDPALGDDNWARLGAGRQDLNRGTSDEDRCGTAWEEPVSGADAGGDGCLELGGPDLWWHLELAMVWRSPP